MNTSRSPYELLSFGNARKLERFGSVVVDRPEPAAESIRSTKSVPTNSVDARFNGDRIGAGEWEFAATVDQTIVEIPGFKHSTMAELVFAGGGQIGLFPEHVAVWKHACEFVAPASNALNLFGYSGLASVALAQHGCEQVTHVDASASAIELCKRNAELNGVVIIRTICEDVLTYLKRAAKQNRKYDIVIADPPAFGRKGSKTWKLERDMPSLLEAITDLLTENGRAYVSGHTPGFTRMVVQWLSATGNLQEQQRLFLDLSCGNDKLHKGTCFVLSHNKANT